MNITCCFTGHRFIERAKIPKIQKILDDEIIHLINHGATEFISGGALGFDMIAAESILKLRRDFPQIRLIMVLPCENQDKYWRVHDRTRYKIILDSADENIYLREEYYDGCMLDRNRYMIENSNVCISYLTQKRGGTLFTVNYAKKKKIEIINISDFL